MNKLRNQMSLFCAVVIYINFITGCVNNPVDDIPDTEKGTSAAIFKIDASSSDDTPFARIADHGTVKITAADMDTMADTLQITDSTVEGKIQAIPAGNNRLFEVFIYDSLDTLQYYGSNEADLPGGSIVNIPVTIYRIGADAEIDIEIIESPDSGMVAFYPFSGDADDSINNNHGTVYGATPTQDRFGNDSAAYEFDGNNDYILIQSSEENNLSNTAFTVSVWVQFYNIDKENMIMYNGDTLGSTNPGSQFWSIYAMPDSTISSCFDDDTVLTRKEPGVRRYKTGHWYLLTFIRDTSENLLKLYCNTELDYTLSDETGPDIDSNFPINIGRFLSSGNPRFFRGKIDDIRIYKRALSETEIERLCY